MTEASSRASNDFLLDRPFHFTTVLWGERFRAYFLDYCLPSLLSPDNIPALRTRSRSKFLIATRPDDWEAMRRSAVFTALTRYVDPVYFEIPPCPPGVSGCEHMGVGHKLMCDYAFAEKSYAVHLTPDCMVSDGSVARLQQLAAEGFEVVLVAALRFGEEPFFAQLRAGGSLGGDRTNEPALTISGRDMARAAVNGFHSETLAYEWEAPYFASVPAAIWWRVPDEDGVLVHSLSWAPMLLDYGAVRRHDTSMLDHWTIDGDYVSKNIGHSKSIYVVQDSDDMFLASWAPMDDKPFSLKPHPLLNFPFARSLVSSTVKGATFRASFYSPTFDALKREIFFRPVRWHGLPLNDAWTKTGDEALDTLLRYLDPPAELASPLRRGPPWRMRVLLPLAHLLILGNDLWVHRDRTVRRLRLALNGDRDSRVRIWRRIKQVSNLVFRPWRSDPGSARNLS